MTEQPPLKSPLEHRIDVLERQKRIYRKILDRCCEQERFECNLCGFYGPFERFGTRKRPNARCPACAGLERSRLLVEVLAARRPVTPADRVLELAPFKGTADYFRYRIGCDFIGVDIDAEKMIRREIPCLQCDLCSGDFETLGTFDVIVNIHVMEHLPCDCYAVIERLTALLRPGGVQVISVPFGGDRTIEDLSLDMPEDRRRARFGHPEHFRAFGHEDFPAEMRARFGARFEEIDRFAFDTPKLRRRSLGMDLPANRMFLVHGPERG